MATTISEKEMTYIMAPVLAVLPKCGVTPNAKGIWCMALYDPKGLDIKIRGLHNIDHLRSIMRHEARTPKLISGTIWRRSDVAVGSATHPFGSSPLKTTDA
jgi:hypothetical protein